MVLGVLLFGLRGPYGASDAGSPQLRQGTADVEKVFAEVRMQDRA
jgi:hypothetical protein